MMNDTYENCYAYVAAHEGGYTVDQGGATMCGVTVPFFRQYGHDLDHDGDIDADDIRKMTPEDAKAAYQKFWLALNIGLISNWMVARKVFDYCVLFGPETGVRLLQRACWANGIPLTEDGSLGPLTAHAVNVVNQEGLLGSMRTEGRRYIEEVLKTHPEWEKDRAGWMNRMKDQ